MDVRLDVLWHVVIEYVRNSLNINSTRSDVGRDQHPESRIAKSIECLLSLCLREVSVESGRWYAVFREPVTEPLRGVLHLCKYHNKRLGVRAKPRSESLALFLLLERVHRMRDTRDR